MSYLKHVLFVSFISLLLITTAYAGDCFKDGDIDDCRAKSPRVFLAAPLHQNPSCRYLTYWLPGIPQNRPNRTLVWPIVLEQFSDSGSFQLRGLSLAKPFGSFVLQ